MRPDGTPAVQSRGRLRAAQPLRFQGGVKHGSRDWRANKRDGLVPRDRPLDETLAAQLRGFSPHNAR